MKLIYAKGACSLSVHILLEELQLSYEAIRVDLNDKKVLESYNTKSYVPALVLDDGAVLTEAINLLEYLSVAHGGRFMPTEELAQARCMEWLTFISTEFHKGAAPLFHRDGLKPSFQAEVEKKLNQRLDFMDQALERQEFLLEEYSIADMYSLAILRILQHIDVDLTSYRNITAYQSRLESMPVIQRVLAVEDKARLATEVRAMIPNKSAISESLKKENFHG